MQNSIRQSVIENRKSACLVCGAVEAHELYPGILRCGACGYVFADIQLSEDELRALYDERFFNGVAYSDYAGDERVLRKNFRLRLCALRRFTNATRHRNLLEIGSAYGFFLDEARRFFSHVEGIDITDAGTTFALEKLKLNVAQAEFLAQDYPERRFDVVCLWDTYRASRQT